MGTLRLLEAIASSVWKRKPVFIRLPPLNCRSGAGNSAERNYAVLPAISVAVAKLYAYWITVNYRESYGITPVTVFSSTMNPRAAVKPSYPQNHPRNRQYRPGAGVVPVLGNMDSLRDWGHAKDYVKMHG